jgi:hypothetical protein
MLRQTQGAISAAPVQRLDRVRSVALRWPGWPAVMVAWLWLALYAPYIRSGGFLRDDLGFVTQQRGAARYLGWLDEPRGFASYPEFQQYVSSFPTMTGRPVSALAHGALYWALGSTIWPYHLINLTLFLASVLLVYAAIRVVLSDALAFLTSAFALVYPSAAGTVFSSIMMNSQFSRRVLEHRVLSRCDRAGPLQVGAGRIQRAAPVIGVVVRSLHTSIRRQYPGEDRAA